MRRVLLAPNALLLACAVYMFHGMLLSGHITRTAALLIMSAAFPLVCGLGVNLGKWLTATAAALNLLTLAMAAYACWGTTNQLLKSGGANAGLFLALGAVWTAALGLAYFSDASGGGRKIAAMLWTGVLCLLAAGGLYSHRASHWAPWMNAVLLGSIFAVAGVNVYGLVCALRDSRKEPAEAGPHDPAK